MTIVGAHHTCYQVADLERSLAFYRDLLGLPVRGIGELTGDEVDRITGTPGVRLLSADLDLGRGQVLELLEYVGAADGVALGLEHPGAGHIGLLVDDLDEVHGSLVAAGVTVKSAPVELTEPGDWHGVRCMTVLDPDGVAVELVERPKRREPAGIETGADRALDA